MVENGQIVQEDRMRDDHLNQNDPPPIPLEVASCAYHLDANNIEASVINKEQSQSP